MIFILIIALTLLILLRNIIFGFIVMIVYIPLSLIAFCIGGTNLFDRFNKYMGLKYSRYFTHEDATNAINSLPNKKKH